MDIAAIIPMKGRSERVPDKNLRLFNGKPLFCWIINELRECVDNIYVDTDCDEIINAVKEYFNQIRFITRPDYLKGDAISMNRIIEYDLTQIDNRYFIQTHSTSPLLTRNTIKSAIQTFFDLLGEHDSLFSVTPIKARCFTSDGAPINHKPDELIQTQYLKPVYVENSGFYLFSRESFLRTSRRIGEKPYLFLIDQYEAIDIDDENDFAAAEVLGAARKGKGI